MTRVELGMELVALVARALAAAAAWVFDCACSLAMKVVCTHKETVMESSAPGQTTWRCLSCARVVGVTHLGQFAPMQASRALAVSRRRTVRALRAVRS